MNNIKRIIVTKSAAKYTKTREIIERATENSSFVELIFHDGDHPKFPNDLNKQQRYEYLKETLVLTTRKSTPFVTTFASPGNIVEDLGAILTMNWHCCYKCEFCYLIGSMYQRQWQEVYVNIDDLERQIVYEKFVHWTILTLWSWISIISGKRLLKIPDNFKVTADWIRKRFIKQNIISEEKAKAFLKDNFNKIFSLLEIKTIGHKMRLIKNINTHFSVNKKFLPWLNVSEYTDFLAIDPITNFSTDLIRILEINPDIQLNIRTKSANVDNLIKYNAHENIKFAINLNTQYAIDNYELGCTSLNDRFEAVSKIQQKIGFLLKIVIEPIIIYDNYEKDYLELIDRIIKDIDLSRIVDFSFGTVRYKQKLKNLINNVMPDNNLDLESKILINYSGDRIRYEETLRKNIYKKIMNKFLRHKKLILRLAAETPQMWDDLGMDSQKHIARSVSQ
ncbi:MAG: hypothetical protein C0412_00030 [Flavobacterium sp.]|nr:hypothetical protein [Flavobacterium sp.]